jgi:uncharacterized protein YdeI (BOF family)
LGQPFGFARLSNPLTQKLQRGLLSQPRKPQSNRDFSSSHYSGDFELAILLWKLKTPSALSVKETMQRKRTSTSGGGNECLEPQTEALKTARRSFHEIRRTILGKLVSRIRETSFERDFQTRIDAQPGDTHSAGQEVRGTDKKLLC